MPSTPSPARDSTPCRRSRAGRTRPVPSSTSVTPTSSRTCSTKARVCSASPPACGPWIYWPNSATAVVGRLGYSAVRLSAWLSNACTSAGAAPSTGSPARIRPTREKKSAGPVDSSGRDAPGLGAGLPGRSAGGRVTANTPQAGSRTNRCTWSSATPTAPTPRPKPRGLLRLASCGHRRDAAAVRARPTCESGHRGLSGLGLPTLGRRGQAAYCWSGITPRGRVRAWLKTHNAPGEARRRLPRGGVSLAEQESVAQLDRAEVGAW